MQQNKELKLLASHVPFDADEARHLQRMTAFIERTPGFARRSTPEGHVTASGWVVDALCRHVLLIHHAKLDRWLQPGGHIEPEDASLPQAAEREVLEETGLSGLTAAPGLFDVDVHVIPARGTEPEHFHYDCRFLFRAPLDAAIRISDEIREARWIAIDSLLCQPLLPDSILRMARKSLAIAAS